MAKDSTTMLDASFAACSGSKAQARLPQHPRFVGTRCAGSSIINMCLGSCHYACHGNGIGSDDRVRLDLGAGPCGPCLAAEPASTAAAALVAQAR